jgi:MIP family channel proteins
LTVVAASLARGSTTADDGGVAQIDGRAATRGHASLAEHWRRHLPRYAGELVGTFVLVVVATGAVVGDAAADGAIGHVGIATATGLVVAAMIYSLGHLTGAHFNPAVSLAFAVGRHFPVRDLLPYWLAQFAGAALAGLFVRFVWGDLAHLGANLPALAAGRALVLEVFLAFALMFVITAVATDTRAVGQGAALAIGFTVLLAVMFAGPASGASMNPARSFGPALVSGTWAHQWIYQVGPPVGAVTGVLVYEFLRRAEKV